MTDLTKDELQHRAREAKRLLNEPLLAEALESVMMTALDELGRVDPLNTSRIYQLQAIVTCTRDIVNSLQEKIAAGGELDGGVSDEATSE